MLQDKFSPAMVDACKKALQNGIFYQEEFERVVKGYMGKPDFTPVLFEDGEINVDDWATRSEISRRLKQKIAESPRGTYAICKLVSSSRAATFETVMSNGTAHPQTDMQYEAKPSEQDVVNRLLRMNIYECRRAIESDVWVTKERTAFGFMRLGVGQQFKNFVDGTDKFSKVTVIETMPDSGMVKLRLQKRGSAGMWEMTIGAIRLAKALNLPYEASQQSEHEIAAATLGEPDLFSMAVQSNEEDEEEDLDTPAPR